MEHRTRSKLNIQIYEEACEWLIECRAGNLDSDSRIAFDQWLRKSPENVCAFLEIASIWNEGASLDPNKRWDADTLIREAEQDPDNIVRLRSANASHAADRNECAPHGNNRLGIVSEGLILPRSRSLLTRRRVQAIAACLIVALGIGAFIAFEMLRTVTYVTAVGEQRSIQLEDGSTVELNSRSKVEIRYSEHERGVELLEGQALFHVAKDVSRPFVVRSGDARVRAVGTQFDVYRKVSGTVVTVVEGRVAVLSDYAVAGMDVFNPGDPRRGASAPTSFPQAESGRAPAVEVSAGEQVIVTPKAARKTEHANIAIATAWTEREIVFDSATLGEVAEEFNRYNQRQLIIEDPALETFHISGMFSSTDPASLVRFLRDRPGLRIVETASEIRIVKNNSQSGGN